MLRCNLRVILWTISTDKMVPLELKTHQNFLSVCIVLLFEAASGDDGSKGVTLLHFFLVYASVVSYVAFLVSLFHYENTPIQIY